MAVDAIKWKTLIEKSSLIILKILSWTCWRVMSWRCAFRGSAAGSEAEDADGNRPTDGGADGDLKPDQSWRPDQRLESSSAQTQVHVQHLLVLSSVTAPMINMEVKSSRLFPGGSWWQVSHMEFQSQDIFMNGIPKIPVENVCISVKVETKRFKSH